MWELAEDVWVAMSGDDDGVRCRNRVNPLRHRLGHREASLAFDCTNLRGDDQAIGRTHERIELRARPARRDANHPCIAHRCANRGAEHTPRVEVVLTRAEVPETDDPVLGQFLGFLSRDLAAHPDRLQALDASFVQRLQSLTHGVEVDLDAPLSADDE